MRICQSLRHILNEYDDCDIILSQKQNDVNDQEVMTVLEALKETVLQGNRIIVKCGLVTLTWGNVSGLDRESGYVVIKPSGIPYETMTAEDMVVIDLDGNRMEGKWNPSSDAATHLVLYRANPEIGGIVHTHSHWATVFAQCGSGIPPLGTTHADTFYGEIPCTRPMTDAEIAKDYEKETGQVILEAIADRPVMDIPAVLVYSHGPFIWGECVKKAVENAIVLEEVAGMAWDTIIMNPKIRMQQSLLDKHYFRKHGADAYYGQRKNED